MFEILEVAKVEGKGCTHLRVDALEQLTVGASAREMSRGFTPCSISLVCNLPASATYSITLHQRPRTELRP